MTVTTTTASFGQRVRVARKDMYMSLEELSALAGIAKSTLWSIENDTAIPMLSTAIAIADALGITVDYLINGGDPAWAESRAFFKKYVRAPEHIQRKTRKIFDILSME